MSFRQSASPSPFAKQRSIPVAWDSVMVQPRTLFEVEAAFEQRKQKWLQETQQQWEAISSGLIADKEQQSIELWDNSNVQCIQTLQGIEKQLVDWQQKWDASTPHPQYRVGNRLSNHPDAYSLPLGRVDGKPSNRID